MSSAESTPGDAGGALAGLTVLELAHVIAGPTIGAVLGDFGAEVIKVEPPEGDSLRSAGTSIDGHSLWFKAIGRNKRSIVIDLRTAAGQELTRELAGTVDVVVESFRPGRLEEWGLDYEALSASNPGLVMLRVSGFGQTGPYAQRPAFGSLVEAMSGFAAITGEPDGPPQLPPYALGDSVAAFVGVGALMMALWERQRSGLGQVIDLSLLEPMMAASLGDQVAAYARTGTLPPRLGNRVAHAAPRNIYRAADGGWLAMAAAFQSVFTRVMRLVGITEEQRPEWFVSLQERFKHLDEIDAAVAEWVGARPLDEALALAVAAGVPVAPVKDVGALSEDEQVRARDVLVEVDDPDLGSITLQNVLFRMSRTPGRIRQTGPRLGADTAAVLGERLSMDDGELQRLAADGTISLPD